MLLTLIIKELRESLMSTRFVVTAVVLVALTGVTVISLTSEHRRQTDDYNRRIELHRQAAAAEPSGRTTIDRPAPALASLFRGINSTLPNQIKLSGQMPPEAKQIVDIESTEAMFPLIDLGFLIGVVLSLVALLFSYDAISGEKERGTLRQMLSNSVSRPVILISKWLAVCATLAVAIIITLGFGALFATSLPGSPLSLQGEDYLVLALIAFASMLYLSIFSLIAILVSSMVSRSASSLAILMLVWVMLIFVFPNASPYLALWIAPAPTRQQVVRAEKQLDSGLLEELKARHANGAKRVIDEKLKGAEMQNLASEINDEWVPEHKQAIDRLREDKLSRLREQEKIGARIASLSPYGVVVSSFAALADSGVAADERFFRLARLFDQDQLTPYSKSLAALQDSKPAPPVFEYRPTPLDERLIRIGSDTVILLTYNLLLLAGCLIAFRRYDVR